MDRFYVDIKRFGYYSETVCIFFWIRFHVTLRLLKPSKNHKLEYKVSLSITWSAWWEWQRIWGGCPWQGPLPCRRADQIQKEQTALSWPSVRRPHNFQGTFEKVLCLLLIENLSGLNSWGSSHTSGSCLRFNSCTTYIGMIPLSCMTISSKG